MPHTLEINQVEEELVNALVAMIGRVWPLVSPAQVVEYLGRFYMVGANDVVVKRCSRADFLLVFSSRQFVD
jgi:hypothetical protein